MYHHVTTGSYRMQAVSPGGSKMEIPKNDTIESWATGGSLDPGLRAVVFPVGVYVSPSQGLA